MNADLAHRARCEQCGEPVVRSTWPDGTPAVLDPRPRCAAVLVRSPVEVQIWPTTECMVEHSAVCVTRIVQRTLAGASVVNQGEPGLLPGDGHEEVAGSRPAATSPA